MVPRTALVICLCLTLAPSVAESGSLAQAPPRVVPRKGPETALVDSLVGFPLDGTLSVLDHPVALYLIGSLFGWPEGATGPEFTPEQDMVLTEVGGVLSSCFEHDASGRPTCVNPEPLLVEVRQATAFGCSYAYSGKCPDRSPAGLLGVFPMTSRGELLAFAYERARMNVPLEGGETYYALFRRQAGASPGGFSSGPATRSAAMPISGGTSCSGASRHPSRRAGGPRPASECSRSARFDSGRPVSPRTHCRET